VREFRRIENPDSVLRAPIRARGGLDAITRTAGQREQDLFRSRLDQIIDMDHALVKLARTIDWRFLEEKFGAVDKDARR